MAYDGWNIIQGPYRDFCDCSVECILFLCFYIYVHESGKTLYIQAQHGF